jgi:hypothetical protein
VLPLDEAFAYTMAQQIVLHKVALGVTSFAKYTELAVYASKADFPPEPEDEPAEETPPAVTRPETWPSAYASRPASF